MAAPKSSSFFTSFNRYSDSTSPSEVPMPPPTAGPPLSKQTELLPESVIEQIGPNGLGVAGGADDSSASTALKQRVVLNDLMDAPARASLHMPNGITAHSQARALRKGLAVQTPEYELDEDDKVFLSGARSPNLETQALLSDSRHPSRATSRSPSPSGILRRIFVERGTPLRPTFPPPTISTYSPQPPRPLTFPAKIHLFCLQTASLVLSTSFLAVVVTWAVSVDIGTKVVRRIKGRKPAQTFPWDDHQYWTKNEKVSKDPKVYARAIGMDIEDETIETEDGYYLRVHRVIDPKAEVLPDGKGGHPILILHGLFQSSGSFITSEDRSLAFWLARQGYQVYLGNTRCVFGMGHRNLSKGDPRFWDWTIRELAMYDLPALVNHVCRETGYSKISFIGHSQGSAQTFISLSVGMCPDLGKKLSVFIALAPAVYAGPLTTGFPFTALRNMEWKTWQKFFGKLSFIPIMTWSYDYAPPKIFAALGYIMFAFLFNWTDTNWLHRRKTKMFRFTPTPVSSASIFWWCGAGGFADRGCIMDDTLDKWYDNRFPPLSLYYGGRDFLVLADPLLDRIANRDTDVKLIRAKKLDLSEHCDFYWAAEAVEWVYHLVKEDIEKTRPRYPHEK